METFYVYLENWVQERPPLQEVSSDQYTKNKMSEAPHSIKSPSFPILITYEVNNIEIYHYDLYRISNTSELFELNIFENLENSITLIEWPEIILKEIKSKKYFSVKFDIIDSFSRKINHNIFL